MTPFNQDIPQEEEFVHAPTHFKIKMMSKQILTLIKQVDDLEKKLAVSKEETRIMAIECHRHRESEEDFRDQLIEANEQMAELRGKLSKLKQEYNELSQENENLKQGIGKKHSVKGLTNVFLKQKGISVDEYEQYLKYVFIGGSPMDFFKLFGTYATKRVRH